MSKSIRIIFITLIILTFFMPVFVKATSVNMNLTNNTTIGNNISTNTVSDDFTNNTEDPSTTDTLAPSQTNTSTNISSTSLNQLPEAELGLNNIINIILIVIGILLVLLGIAIIIRLKH
ncbi:MAG: hypothetical protein HFJ27_00430 [Clostridia bacterium]|nr:hypothetical protein [Clostridia bacterium]